MLSIHGYSNMATLNLSYSVNIKDYFISGYLNSCMLFNFLIGDSERYNVVTMN